MKKILVALHLAGSFLSANAQVDPLYAQYMMNPLLINPAYSGLNNNLNIGATYRKQWNGLDGNPATFNINAHTSLSNNKMGLGAIILKDQIGNKSTTEVHLSYAYHITLQQKVLSFGLQGGVMNFRTDNTKLNPYDTSDPMFAGTQNSTKPSLGIGLILNTERYFIGISVPRILNVTNTINDLSQQLYTPHFYSLLSYVIYLDEHIRLKPAALLKGVKGSPLSADLNLSATVNEKYTAGLFTRNFNAYGLLLQLTFGKGYRAGYVFEVPTNKSVGTQFTTHEFMLGLNMAVLNFHNTAITNF